MAQVEQKTAAGSFFSTYPDTTAAQAISQVEQMLKNAIPLPSDWKWSVRDADTKLFLELMSPRYPGAVTMTDVEVRAYDYYSSFGNQTSPIVRDDAYGSAINSVRYLLATNRNFPQMVIDRLVGIENNIDLDAARRQRAIEDDARRRAEQSAAEKAAADEAARRAAERETLAAPPCCGLVAVGGPVTVGNGAAPSPAPEFVGPTNHVVAAMPEGGGIYVPAPAPTDGGRVIDLVGPATMGAGSAAFVQPPGVTPSLEVRAAAEVPPEPGKVDPLIVFAVLVVVMIALYLWS